jgi:hypothetical protein
MGDHKETAARSVNKRFTGRIESPFGGLFSEGAAPFDNVVG